MRSGPGAVAGVGAGLPNVGKQASKQASKQKHDLQHLAVKSGSTLQAWVQNARRAWA